MSAGTTLVLPETNGHTPMVPAVPLDAATLEMVVVGNDLAKLNPAQRLQWYNARCMAAGLDPRTQPFQYIVLQGKLTLYATKSASDQLTAVHKLKTAILSRGWVDDTGVYEVHAKVTFPDGRTGEDIGSLYIGGLKGQDLANAMMKTVTKAKRRTVLSACGLGGIPDESELETIKDAARPLYDEEGNVVGSEPLNPALPPPRNNSGHGRGQYASEEQAKAYSEAIRAYIDTRNRDWVAAWESIPGVEEHLTKIPELMTIWQANGHIVKWAISTGRLDPTLLPEDLKTRQRDNYPAIVYHASAADRKALKIELRDYIDKVAGEKTEAIYRAHPELRPEGQEDDGDIPAEFEEADPDAFEPGRE